MFVRENSTVCLCPPAPQFWGDLKPLNLGIGGLKLLQIIFSYDNETTLL